MDPVIFLPNIETILWRLETSPEKYPANNRSYDWAFGDFPAIPTCYKFVIQVGDIPGVAETHNHLIKSHYPKFNQLNTGMQVAIRSRALKLTMDFYRDLHAMALLGLKFGSVVYERGLDLGYNIDYRVKPKPFLLTGCFGLGRAQLGVQASMMHPRNWRNPDGSYLELKKQRRARRNCQEWDGDIFLLSNQTRRFWRSVNGLWLFGIEHVNDLIDDVKAKYKNNSDNNPDFGIVQLSLFD